MAVNGRLVGRSILATMWRQPKEICGLRQIPQVDSRAKDAGTPAPPTKDSRRAHRPDRGLRAVNGDRWLRSHTLD